MTRDYYNRRTGKDGGPPKLTLAETAEMIARTYAAVEGLGYLQRAFGYYCVDDGDVSGVEGCDLHMGFLLKTTIRITGNVEEVIKKADEVLLFTFIEFIYDHVAKPAEGSGRYHSYSGCGMHYRASGDFDERAARSEWRAKVNAVLKLYEGGYELSDAGEILHLAPDGMLPLLQAELPKKASTTDRDKIGNAVRVFQLGRSTRTERKQAVRELIDVLEYHRPQVKTHLLSKDESELFSVANNFAIRHHRDNQKDDYDDSFLSWPSSCVTPTS